MGFKVGSEFPCHNDKGVHDVLDLGVILLEILQPMIDIVNELLDANIIFVQDITNDFVGCWQVDVENFTFD